VVAGTSWVVAVVLTAPVWGQPFRPGGLVAAAPAAVLSWWAARVAAGCGRRGRVVACGVGTAVVGLFLVGAAGSVVVGGRVYSSRSDTAKAWRLVEAARKDLYRISAMSELVDLDTARARSRLRDYEDAIGEMKRIRDRWAGRGRTGGLPSDLLKSVVDHMGAAADFGVVALERRRALLLESDARLAAELESAARSLVAEVRAAGDAMARVAELYGFDLTGGVRE
jgi:hypothetical protein